MAPPDLVVPLPLEFVFMTALTQALYSVLLLFRLIHISVKPHPTSDNTFKLFYLQAKTPIFSFPCPTSSISRQAPTEHLFTPIQ